MRFVDWHCNLINKRSAQALDSASGREIVGVAGNGDFPANRADKRRNRSTRLQCIAVTSKTLGNLKSNVTGTNSNVLRMADTKIEVSDV
jgi:hypothetical protein